MWLNSFDAGSAVLLDGKTGAATTRAEIEARASVVGRITPARGLAFVLADSTTDSAATIHAVLAAQVSASLLDATSPEDVTTALVDRYHPDVIIGGVGGSLQHVLGSAGRGYESCYNPHIGPYLRRVTPAEPINPDLAVLLTTSGSTGSPKLVRLSRQNIVANAIQIAGSLDLRPDDRGVSSLPFHYSFGMSILTSHAVVGSPVVVTASSVLESALWDQIDNLGVTLFPGVPQTYHMLSRIGFLDKFPQTIRALLQAGGRLEPALVIEFADIMERRGGEFFVMYGQTEASPRMACLPPRDLRRKLGSVGVALQGGNLQARSPGAGSSESDAPSMDPFPAGEVGEIYYTGPNVMMGYAENRIDLTLGDTHGDTLATGDLGYVDNEGFLYLTGRTKRIAKVAGLRISLDEVEAMVANLQSAAIEAPPGTITLATSAADTDGSHRQAARDLARALRVPPKCVRVIWVASLPLLPSGKVDYQALVTLVGE